MSKKALECHISIGTYVHKFQLNVTRSVIIHDNKYTISFTQSTDEKYCVNVTRHGNYLKENEEETMKELDKLSQYDKKLSHAQQQTEKNIDTLLEEFKNKLVEEKEFDLTFLQNNEKLFAMMAGDLRVSQQGKKKLESHRSRTTIDVLHVVSEEFSFQIDNKKNYYLENLSWNVRLNLVDEIQETIKLDPEINKNYVSVKIEDIIFDQEKKQYTRKNNLIIRDVFLDDEWAHHPSKYKILRVHVEKVEGQYVCEYLKFSGSRYTRTYKVCQKTDADRIFLPKKYKQSDFAENELVLALYDYEFCKFRLGYVSFLHYNGDLEIYFDGLRQIVPTDQIWKISDLPERFRNLKH
ncbi:MAG: hypothetical protein Dasosvirus1_29 [Dasosvirus sp.]|uniref:Uncharacterized protein n=1 Tax=Dasosvirus sp. TaxID=2487764 RepID=A0A3G4ZSV0_9VIRU|nr:MAG: hypothetical protein Dasosvirus1_29 [Dasosvirus sp.]